MNDQVRIMQNYHPDDFTHGLLAKHCYFKSEKGQSVERFVRHINKKTNKQQSDDFLKGLFITEQGSSEEDITKKKAKV